MPIYRARFPKLRNNSKKSKVTKRQNAQTRARKRGLNAGKKPKFSL